MCSYDWVHSAPNWIIFIILTELIKSTSRLKETTFIEIFSRNENIFISSLFSSSLHQEICGTKMFIIKCLWSVQKQFLKPEFRCFLWPTVEDKWVLLKSVSCQGADVASGAGTAKKTQRDLYFWGECLHIMSDHSMAWIFWISLTTFY